MSRKQNYNNYETYRADEERGAIHLSKMNLFVSDDGNERRWNVSPFNARVSPSRPSLMAQQYYIFCETIRFTKY